MILNSTQPSSLISTTKKRNESGLVKELALRIQSLTEQAPVQYGHNTYSKTGQSKGKR
jgi:hypothetical protein